MEGEAHIVLVRSMSGEKERGYDRMEFHMVDLDGDEVVRNCLPWLLNGLHSPGYMVRLADDGVYILGKGYRGYVDEIKKQEEKPSEAFFYMGSSRIDLRDAEASWEGAPLPLHHVMFPTCVSLCGKMYKFELRLVDPEVFDPNWGHWRRLSWFLPPNLKDCLISMPVLADPCHGRLIMLLVDDKLKTQSLYAFYPPGEEECGGKWELIDSCFDRWSCEAVTIEDNVPYVHYWKNWREFELVAYDLATKRWLDIEWSQVQDVDMRYYEFHAFLNLGNSMLCLATHTCDFQVQPPVTKIIFYKFRVKRSTTSASVISASCLCKQSYTLPSTRKVVDFMLL